MQIARHQEEAPRRPHQENPETCLSLLTSQGNQACNDSTSTCTSTSDEQCDAPASSVRPARLHAAHAPSVHAPAKAVCPKLVQAYLPLVHQVVTQLARRLPPNVLREDLISAGVIGLLDSLRRNVGDRGAAFEWYAKTRIHGAVIDELRAQDWISRRARSAMAKAEKQQGPAPRLPTLVSLHDLDDGEADKHLSSEEDDAEERLAQHDEQSRLRRALQELPEREQRIVRMHYFDSKKLKDIGLELGISEPRVWQLLTRAQETLRAILSDKPQREKRESGAIPLRPQVSIFAKARLIRMKRAAAARCVA